MLNLLSSTSSEIRNFGQQLRLKYHDAFDTMEEAAQAVCQEIFESFRDRADNPAFVLFRIFRLGTLDDLPPSLQDEPYPDVDNALVLMGSAGLEEAWNNRHTSQAHQVLPIDDSLSPMFKAAFDQTRLSPRLATELEELAVDTFTNYFHVEHVPSSAAVPDQAQFVEPYGVQSMVGFGSRFLSGAAYLAVGFSTQTLKSEDVRRFSEMSIFMSTLLSAYDGRGRLWNE